MSIFQQLKYIQQRNAFRAGFERYAKKSAEGQKTFNWSEDDHARDEGGKFTSGGSSEASKDEKETKERKTTVELLTEEAASNIHDDFPKLALADELEENGDPRADGLRFLVDRGYTLKQYKHADTDTTYWTLDQKTVPPGHLLHSATQYSEDATTAFKNAIQAATDYLGEKETQEQMRADLDEPFENLNSAKKELSAHDQTGKENRRLRNKVSKLQDEYRKKQNELRKRVQREGDHIGFYK